MSFFDELRQTIEEAESVKEDTITIATIKGLLRKHGK